MAQVMACVAWWHQAITCSHYDFKKMHLKILSAKCWTFCSVLNSLRPSDTIGRQRTGSTLAQIIRLFERRSYYAMAMSICLSVSLYHKTFVFSLRRPFVRGLFVSWGATGWRFVINSRANIHVTIDCSTVLPLVLGVVTRQKPQINGSVVLGADESPWPCGTPSWYTPLSWMILSKQKNLHLFYHNTFVFSLRCPSVRVFLTFFNMVWDINLKLGIYIQ